MSNRNFALIVSAVLALAASANLVGCGSGGSGGSGGGGGGGGSGGSGGSSSGDVADPTFAIVMDEHLTGDNGYREEYHSEITYRLAGTWLDTVGPGVPMDLWKMRGGMLGLQTGESLPFVPATFNSSADGWLAGEHQQATTSVVDPRDVSVTATPSARLRRTAAGAEIEFRFLGPPIPPEKQYAIGGCGSHTYKPTPYVFTLTKDELQRFADVKKSLDLTMPLNDCQCTGSATAVLTATLPSRGDVTVTGPSCICGALEPGEFQAQAKQSGGTFDQFEITGGDNLPDVLTNQGGDTATLKLEGDAKTTNQVQLVATYHFQGKTFRSEPFTVNFARVDKPKLVGNAYHETNWDWSYNDATPGHVEIELDGQAWMNGEDVASDLQWTVSPNPNNLLKLDQPRSNRLKLVGDGLPDLNTDFGPRTITNKLHETNCDCAGEDIKARLFYQVDAKNNPVGKQPNWVYYWRQTAAGREMATGEEIAFSYVDVIPPPVYGKLNTGAAEVARYEQELDVIYVTHLALDSCCHRRDGTSSKGIDCLAETLNHENHHRQEFFAWWGPLMERYPATCLVAIGPTCDADSDLDYVPNDVELAHGCDPNSSLSCPGLPAWCGGMTDLEFDAYDYGWSWPQGSADKEDWACPGKQCPR
jgi:hypothetical protein